MSDQSDALEMALADLAEPRLILAEALVIVRGRLTDEAHGLIRIAEIAGQLAAAECTVYPIIDDGLDEAGTEDRTVPPGGLPRAFEPYPVNGIRFTADITARYIGRVADGLWAYVPDIGFLCVSGAVSIEAVSVGVTFDVQFSGRIVSATPDHVLCVTDGGTSVTLPRALIVESADE